MPNWIGNYLTVAGPAAEVRRFVRQARGRQPGSDGAPPGPELSFNFHSLVPLPAAYSQVPYSTFGSGARGLDMEMETWGISWGAVRPREPLLDPGMAHYRFDTAWGAPTEFLGKVYVSWPTLVFLLSWGGEGPVRGTAWFAGNRSVQVEDEWPEGWPDYPDDEDFDTDRPEEDSKTYRLAVKRAERLRLAEHPVFVARQLAQRAGFSAETPLEVLYDWVLEQGWQYLARGLGCSAAFWPGEGREGRMTTEEAFLGDIAADPSNAAVRLIYADWLLEQGREDESYAWRWATARARYPFVSIHTSAVWWCCDVVNVIDAALPRHVWWALKPHPYTLRQRYSCAGVPWAFGALAQALRRLRNEVAIP